MLETIKNNNKLKTNNYKNLQCLNCGYYGHAIKTCNYPITSYGILCYYIDINDDIKYLMIQRKDSLCYVEFMRGFYELENIHYLYKLFKYITLEEKERIINNDFDTLWNLLWKNYNNIHKFKKDYENSKQKFNKLKKGFNKKNILINFDFLFNQTKKDSFEETEYEFPKGRRNLNENNISTAIREFEEESGLSRDKINLINTKSYEEIYIAMNNVRYRHIYYIAKCNENDFNNISNLFNPNNKTQIKEVIDVKWLDYNQVLDNIRNIYLERKELFKRLHKVIKKYESNRKYQIIE
jgi:8-oxo-dGTP pyrophosphatase MutT (NUDIX family)